MKIQNKFLYLNLILLAGVLVIGLSSQMLFYNSYRRNIIAQIRNTAYYVDHSLTAEIATVEKITFRICTDRSVQQELAGYRDSDSPIQKLKGKKALSDLLLAYVFEKNYITSIHLLLDDADSITVGKDIAAMDRETRAAVWAAAEGAGGTNRLVPLGLEPGKLASVRAVREIAPLSLDVLGVVAVHVDLDGCVGQIMAQAPSSSFLSVRSPDGILFDNAGPEGGRSAVFAEETVRGNRCYLVEYRDEERDWIFRLFVPTAAFRAPMRGLITVTVVFYLLLSCLFILVFYTELKGIIMPILSFTQIMRDFESQDFKVPPNRIPPRGSFDEINIFIRVFTGMADRIHRLIHENYRRKIKLQEAEYRTLQAQINPHFLYNTFDSINWLAQMKGEREISSMIVALSALLRSSIADPGKLLSLREEADLLGQYVLIQKMRLAERLECSVEIGAGLERVLIPRLTLQPLVENSIGHCLESMVDVCRVQVKAVAREGTAVISVIDNGPGIPKERIDGIFRAGQPGRSTGLGMANIDERLKIIFGRPYGLRVARGRRRGARIDVRIPISGDGIAWKAAP